MPLDNDEKPDMISQRRTGEGYSVRRFELRDTDRVIALLKQSMHDEMFAQSMYAAVELIDEKIAYELKQIIDYPKRAIGIVAVNDADEVVGVFGGVMVGDFHSLNLTAVERILYVLPEYRSLATLHSILAEFEAWARSEIWCKRIQLGVHTSSRSKALIAAYLRMGYAVTPTTSMHKDI
jgi:hypothetical protein